MPNASPMYLLAIGAYLAVSLLLCVRLWRMKNSPATRPSANDWFTDWMSMLVTWAYLGFWTWRVFIQSRGHIGPSVFFFIPIIGISIWRVLRDFRRQPPRFSLGELFVLTTALAVYFAIARLFEPGSHELSMFTIVALIAFLQARKWQLKRRRQRVDTAVEPSTAR